MKLIIDVTRKVFCLPVPVSDANLSTGPDDLPAASSKKLYGQLPVFTVRERLKTVLLSTDEFTVGERSSFLLARAS